MTNYERILVCKEIERYRVFGRFDRMYAKHRDSGRFKFQECLVAAGTTTNNNVDKTVLCMRDYMQSVKRDSDEMSTLFKKDYARFL